MRTTVRLPDDLMRAVKRHAAATDRTLTAVIEDALRAALARSERAASAGAEPLGLPTWGHGGTRQGVDLDDSAALRDHMDGREE